MLKAYIFVDELGEIAHSIKCNASQIETQKHSGTRYEIPLDKAALLGSSGLLERFYVLKNGQPESILSPLFYTDQIIVCNKAEVEFTLECNKRKVNYHSHILKIKYGDTINISWDSLHPVHIKIYPHLKHLVGPHNGNFVQQAKHIPTDRGLQTMRFKSNRIWGHPVKFLVQ